MTFSNGITKLFALIIPLSQAGMNGPAVGGWPVLLAMPGDWD
jgi:hypothetical protein